MKRNCSTGQNPQRALAPMEEEEAYTDLFSLFIKK
jgi:hypothetical protein